MARLQSISMPIDPQINNAKLNELQRKAKQAAGASTDHLQKAFSNWAKNTEQLFKKAFDFTNYFKGIADRLNKLIDFDFLLTGVQKLKSAIGTATSQIWDSFKGASKGLKSLIKTGKSTLKQFGQLIGKQFAFDMQAPMKQLVNWFKKNRKQINKSLTSLARNIGHLFDSFAKGLIGVVKVGKSFFEWFNKLPNSIKGTTYAIMAMWAILKAGPIGVLSAIVTFAGELIDDYETYVRRMNGESDGLSALDGLWQLIYDPSGKGLDSDKIKGIAGTVMTKIFEGASAWLDEAGPQIATLLTDLTNTISRLMIDAANALSGTGEPGVGESFKKFGESLGNFLATILVTAIQSMGTLGGAVVQSIGSSVAGISPDDWEKQFGTDFKQNSFADALGSFLMISLFTGSPTKGLIAAIVSFFVKAFAPASDQIEDGTAQGLDTQAVKFATAVAEFLCGGFKKIQLFSETITGSIVEFFGNVFSTFTGKENEGLSQDAKAGISRLLSGFISYAGASLITGGNLAVSIGAAFVGFFGDAISKAWDAAWDHDEIGRKTTFNAKKFKQKFLTEAGDSISDLGNVFFAVLDVAIGGIDWVSKKIDGLIVGVAKMLDNSFKDMTQEEVIAQMGDGTLDIIKAVIGGVVTTALTGGNWKLGMAGALGTLLLQEFNDAKNKVAEGKSFQSLQQDDWNNILNEMLGGVQQVGQTFLTWILAVLKSVTTWWRSGGQEEFNKLIQPIKDAWNELWEGDEQSGFEGLKVIFGNVWNDVSDGFVTMISSLWEKVKGPVNNLAQNIALAIYNSLPQGLIKQLWGDAPKVVNKNDDGTFTLNYGKQSVTRQDVEMDDGTMWSDFIAKHPQAYKVDDDGQLAIDLNGILKGDNLLTWTENDQKYIAETLNGYMKAGDTKGAQALLQNVQKLKNETGFLEDGALGWTNMLVGNLLNALGWKSGKGSALEALQNYYQDNKHNSRPSTSRTANQGTEETESSDDTKRAIKRKGKKVTRRDTDSDVTTSSGDTIIIDRNPSQGEKSSGQVTQSNSGAILIATKQSIARMINVQSAVNSGSSSITSQISNSASGINSNLTNIYNKIPKLTSSEGRRVDSYTTTSVGQDGVQYIIPITKTGRAVALIQQMVSQMGITAQNAIANALGISTDISTIGGSMMSGAGIGSSAGVNIVYNNNVSAPVTINVTSSGASADAIGQQVYSSAQRALLKTLKSAIG